MNQPKYQIGDRVHVAGLPVEIIKHDYSKSLATYLYTVRFECLPAMVTIVEERDLMKLLTA
jgi:hypothetical protein